MSWKRSQTKSKRKELTGGKAVCSACKNHGSCSWCRFNRLYTWMRDKEKINDLMLDDEE